MIDKIFLPMLGETMDEGTIASWHKSEGDAVSRGDVVLEITTDKATLEVQSYSEGTIRKILAPEGALVAVNEPIAILADPDDDVPEDVLNYRPKSAAELKKGPSKAAPAPAPAEPEGRRAPEGGEARGAHAPAGPAYEAASPPRRSRGAVRSPDPEGRGAGPALAASPPPYQVPPAPMAGARIPVTPRAKLVAKERDLGWRFLVGSGPSGRLRERDVLAYGEEVASLDVTPAARRLAAQKQVDLREIEGTGPAGRITEHDVARAEPSMPAGGFERRELDAMRRTIAHRMSWSWRNMPQFSLTVAVDMSAASRTRERIKEEGTKVSFTDMIVKAAALALRDHPEVASLFDRDTVIRRAGLHVGIAVALDEGLIVPVVRHADKRPLVELSAAAKDLVARARSNRLIPDEYTGGVLTVSNMGMLGIDEFTAIVNPGESAIVACGRILDAPVVVEGEVVARPVLTLTGAFDHRAVDGAQGARYLSRVKELLESPEELV